MSGDCRGVVRLFGVDVDVEGLGSRLLATPAVGVDRLDEGLDKLRTCDCCVL